jgi:hypothetical protein
VSTEAIAGALRRLEERLARLEGELQRQSRLLLAIGIALTDDKIDSDLILRAEQERLAGPDRPR